MPNLPRPRRWLLRRGWLTPPMPVRDDAFVAAVRTHFDPVVLPAGFVFNGASVGASLGPRLLATKPSRAPVEIVRTTTVLYEAQPAEFAARFPGLRAAVGDEDACLDLWVDLDADRHTVEVAFEGRTPAALLAEIDPRAPWSQLPDHPLPDVAVAWHAELFAMVLDLAKQAR